MDVDPENLQNCCNHHWQFLDQCVKNVWMCAKIFDKLGFVIHPEKSVFIPSQTIEYLGVIIDSNKMTVTLTADKKTTIFNLCLGLLTEKIALY